MNFSRIPRTSLAGRFLRSVLRVLPPDLRLPILQGRLRGKRWIAGSGVHGYWLGSYEWQKRQVFETVVTGGSVVYDVGANVGFYTLLASELVGPNGRVVAFEPLPRNLYYFKRHLALNRVCNVVLAEAAAWDRYGMVHFDPGPDNSEGAVSQNGTLEVPGVTLAKASLKPTSGRGVLVNVERAGVAPSECFILPTWEAPTVTSPSLSTILRDRTTLSITSFDRLYLNGYVPRLQSSGQLVAFCRDRLDAPIPSPALFGPLRERFVTAVQALVERLGIPLIHFVRRQRKDDVAAWHRARFQAEEGVVFVGVAQEKASSFKATKRTGDAGRVSFDFTRQPVAVNHYYFYVQDREWGPAFLKVGSYLPYPVRVCLNANEWAKQQLRREGIAFEALDNGFRWCEDPERLQQVCDALGPADVQAFFDRWVERLPWPLTPADRAAGYRHRLSLWQVEVSLTQVFAEPSWGRRFFEGVIRENLDLGRPDRVGLLFPTKLTRATPPPPFGYRTRVLTRGVQPSLHVDFKRSHVKQYFKEGWALRTETTFNDPTDVQPTKALETLPHLRAVGRQINARLLATEHLSLSPAAPEPSLIERVQQPRRVGAQRVPALQLSDSRVLALLQALCQVAPRPDGFRHRGLRPLVAGLLGPDLVAYAANAMTYDLRRLRLHGLIARVPHSVRYTATADGLHLAFGLSRIYARLLRPSWAALLSPGPEVPPPLRDALLHLDAALAHFAAVVDSAPPPLAHAA